MFESQGINTTGLVAAWKLVYTAGLMNEVDRTLGTSQYNLVDVGRQCLANIFYDLQKMVRVVHVVWLKDEQNLISYVQLQNVADVMLEVRIYYWGWIAYFYLIPMWGYRDNVGDYAAKHWSGLVNSYILLQLLESFFSYMWSPMCWVPFPGWPQELNHLRFSTSQRSCVLLKAEHVIEEKQDIKVNFNIIFYTWITHTGFHTNIIDHEPVMLYCDRFTEYWWHCTWWWLNMCT